MMPRTELDHRYSDPGSVATTWQAARRVLEEAQLAWLTTVRADGRPHVTPVVPVWVDGAAYFSTGPDEQKSRNLAHDRQVALTTGCATWQEGLDVVVEGRAERVTDPDLLARLADAWSTRWDGDTWDFRPSADGFAHGHGTAHVYELRPAKVLAFGKGTSTHTRHVFDR